MNREQRKKTLDTLAEESQIMDMFDKLPNHCLVCLTPYDKKDKKMVTTWNVVVREKEKIVRLYCPECWNKAVDLIKEVQDDFRIREETRVESPGESES